MLSPYVPMQYMIVRLPWLWSVFQPGSARVQQSIGLILSGSIRMPPSVALIICGVLRVLGVFNFIDIRRHACHLQKRFTYIVRHMGEVGLHGEHSFPLMMLWATAAQGIVFRLFTVKNVGFLVMRLRDSVGVLYRSLRHCVQRAVCVSFSL